MHRQIINDCYKNNLLIKPNKMKVNGNDSINLRKITISLLIIDTEKDDLVATGSSMAVRKHVYSQIQVGM